MISPINNLRSGDLVKVKHPLEILKTLDENGCLDNLPFMPEMIKYCGKILKVKYRIEKTCVETERMVISAFKNNNVVFLEEARCSGVNHHNCQRACMIFWKEAWLVKVNSEKQETEPNQDDVDTLRKVLKTCVINNRYFCQSTELTHATKQLSRIQRISKVFADLKYGTYDIFRMLELITIPVIRKLFKKIKDQHPKGYLTKTPAAALNLQPGELVEIKSLEEIVETLDLKGKNRGLSFEPDMIAYCGKRFKVKSRLDRMILEKNGQMVEVKNSVLLENATCNCYYAFAGCPRREYQYWREIWLRRIAIMIIFISHLSIELMNLKPELKLFSIANYQQTLMFFGIAA